MRPRPKSNHELCIKVKRTIEAHEEEGQNSFNDPFGNLVFLLIPYLIFVLFYAWEGSFRPITAIPFFIGPITIPQYLSYKRIAQQLKNNS